MEEGQEILDHRYKIIKKLGGGAFGELYRVEKKKTGDLSMILSLKSSKNIEKLANEATLWRFWMLCVTLLMFPLGTVLCYMALRIRYGPHIKRYRQVILVKLAKLKKKPWKLSGFEVRSKVRSVILKKLRREGILSIENEIKK